MTEFKSVDAAPVRISKGCESVSAFFNGTLNVLEKTNEYEFAVELWIMRDGINNNNWDYRNLEENYLSFLGTPILCAYVNGQVGDGHNMREKRDMRTGEIYYSFTDATSERIVGSISENKADLALKKRDGHTWIVAKGKLWKFYAPELTEKIVRTGRMNVSAETEIKRMKNEGDVEVFESWSGLGVTILGDRVAPAIPGANISALASIMSEFRELKLRAAALRDEKQGRNDIKAKRKGVTKNMNKQAVARLSSQFDGYRIVGLSEDEMHLALVDTSGNAFTYTFNEEDKGEVIASKIVPAKIQTVFKFDSVDVEADIADIVDFVAGNASEKDKNAKAQIAALSESLEKANKKIKALEEGEHARRLEAVKNAISNTLDAIKRSEDAEGKEFETAANEALENLECYAGMEKDGKFAGDKQASYDIMAKCMEMRLKKAEEKRKELFAWGNSEESAASSGGIEETLAFINN